MIPLPDIAAWARFALHATALTLLAAIVYNMGAARQGELNVRTIDNANGCVALLSQAVEVGERSAALHVSRQRAVAAFLGKDGDVVADVDAGHSQAREVGR